MAMKRTEGNLPIVVLFPSTWWIVTSFNELCIALRLLFEVPINAVIGIFKSKKELGSYIFSGMLTFGKAMFLAGFHFGFGLVRDPIYLIFFQRKKKP